MPKPPPNQEMEVESWFRPLGMFDEPPFKILLAIFYISLVTIAFAVLRDRDIQSKVPAPPPVFAPAPSPGPAPDSEDPAGDEGY